jgi:hypothetical protein
MANKQETLTEEQQDLCKTYARRLLSGKMNYSMCKGFFEQLLDIDSTRVCEIHLKNAIIAECNEEIQTIRDNRDKVLKQFSKLKPVPRKKKEVKEEEVSERDENIKVENPIFSQPVKKERF